MRSIYLQTFRGGPGESSIGKIGSRTIPVDGRKRRQGGVRNTTREAGYDGRGKNVKGIVRQETAVRRQSGGSSRSSGGGKELVLAQRTKTLWEQRSIEKKS